MPNRPGPASSCGPGRRSRRPPASREQPYRPPRAATARPRMMARDMVSSLLNQIDPRTRTIFGGYLAAFALVALTVLLGLPPLVRFGASVIALAAGARAAREATEARRATA